MDTNDIREKLKELTPGEWCCEILPVGRFARSVGPLTTWEKAVADSRFIQASRPLMEKIIDLLDEKDREVQELKQALDELKKDSEPNPQKRKKKVEPV